MLTICSQQYAPIEYIVIISNGSDLIFNGGLCNMVELVTTYC